MCRHAGRYQYAYDFVICENCYNKNTSKKSKENNNSNAQKQQDMFTPLINEHTGEAWCVENPLEYHTLQYLKMLDFAHIWTPSWQCKNTARIVEPKKEF